MNDRFDEQDDGEFERWLRTAAQDYHVPGEPPRELMWARIQAARRLARSRPRRFVIAAWMTAAAAVLALVFGLGRWTASRHTGSTTMATQTTAPSSTTSGPTAGGLLQVAAVDHLARTEVFLTGLKTDAHARQPSREFSEHARDLLTTTRLLLDSPALTDPRLRSLLEDLELTLAQIAQLEVDSTGGQMDLITRDLEQRGVMPRLRTAIPAGPARFDTQGES